MRCLKAVLAASLFVFAVVPAADAESISSGTLSVVPVGLESSRGSLLVQLSKVAASFEGEGEAFRSAEVKVVDGQAAVVFENIPHGDYALKVFHDENENQKLDTNFIGMPKEPIAMSNNAVGKFGPPKYEDAVFNLGPEPMIQHITMKEL